MTPATGSYPAPVPYAALVLDDQGVLRSGGGPVAAGPVLDALVRARARGLRTAVLSNADRVDPALTALVHHVVVSGETGWAKPHPKAFRGCAERLGVDPTACVFIDDVPANVRAAVAVGMTGVLHRTAEQAAGELAVLLD